MASGMVEVLVTGGAGFIGSHLVERLLAAGHSVRVYDNLEPQVHGENAVVPAYLPKEAEFILGDLRDRDKLAAAMRGIEVIYHQGAAVGIGQSMYLGWIELFEQLGPQMTADIVGREVRQ